VAKDLEAFGAEGITVHPRPDERHIRYQDVRELKPLLKTEFNIEGNPLEEKFVQLVLEVKPDQVTLVPDSSLQLTSDHGWDTIASKEYLSEIIGRFKNAGIRTSIFVDADLRMVEGAKATGTDRIELYTESYAQLFKKEKAKIIGPFHEAGHDLNLENLAYFASHVPGLLEVSIGHALISDALYFGLENTVQMYLRCLNMKQVTN
jgi:pyridoxine 5-phosphate synthase